MGLEPRETNTNTKKTSLVGLPNLCPGKQSQHDQPTTFLDGANSKGKSNYPNTKQSPKRRLYETQK